MVNGRTSKRYVYTPRKSSQITCVPCKVGLLVSLGDGGKKKYILTEKHKVIFPNGDTIQLDSADRDLGAIMTDVLTMCFAFRDEGWRPPKEGEEGSGFTLKGGQISLTPPTFKDGKLVVKRGRHTGEQTHHPMGGGNRVE